MGRLHALAGDHLALICAQAGAVRLRFPGGGDEGGQGQRDAGDDAQMYGRMLDHG